MKRIAFVCLGNICRSPMAEFVMKNLTSDYHIESRATSGWEKGHPIHHGTQGIFKTYGIPYDTAKSSTRMSEQDFYDFDIIIGMDEQNVRDLQAMAPAGTQHKIYPFATTSVPDPYYTGDFEETYTRVTSGCKDWLDRLAETEK